MEADEIGFDRIEGAAQTGSPDLSSGVAVRGGTAAVRTLSCDGIWAQWSTADSKRSEPAPGRYYFSVGPVRRHRYSVKADMTEKPRR